MFRNLNAEMARRGITRQDLAKKIGIGSGSLSRKLNGVKSFTLEELNAIRDVLHEILPLNISLDVLFDKSENLESTQNEERK